MTDAPERFAVHAGIPFTRIVSVADLFTQASEAFRIDGDGWFTWGAPIGEAGNDRSTFHLVVSTTSVVRTCRLLVTVAGQLVNRWPGGPTTRTDVLIVVTDADDHDEVVMELGSEMLAAMALDWVADVQVTQASSTSRP